MTTGSFEERGLNWRFIMIDPRVIICTMPECRHTAAGLIPINRRCRSFGELGRVSDR